GWAILLRQKQKKLIMLPSETMIWQPEFTDKTLSRKPGAVHIACTQQFLSWQEYSSTFLRFSPVVMPVKVVRRFHHQRRLRLTTSGGTFS
ncbi:hypothetical protein, partial [Escherichia coli]|uniref:hypothetical protein n=1 Tax=Escherichia coli TaxID=562 RepID=UPI0019D62CC4